MKYNIHWSNTETHYGMKCIINKSEISLPETHSFSLYWWEWIQNCRAVKIVQVALHQAT